MIFAFTIGCIFGIISGLVPGITLFVSLIMVYPFLLAMSPLEVMVVYITLASMSQFFGSVSATLFSVPGSLTSLPALYEGHYLTKQGQGSQAIMFAAIGSFIGSVSAVLISLFLINYIFVFYFALHDRVEGSVAIVSTYCIRVYRQQSLVYKHIDDTFGHRIGPYRVRFVN